MADLRLPELNRVMLAGRLTRDPELRYTPGGAAVCKMGLASDRRFRTKDGEQRVETLFINLTAWAKTAEFCSERLRKGRPVLVEGELRSSEWEDKQTGQKRSMIEVNVSRLQTLDWEDQGGGGGGGGSSSGSGGGGNARSESYRDEEPVPDDDIPF